MSTRGLKKWALLLTFWVALHVPSLRAQTLPFIPTGGNSGVDFEFQTDGTLLAEGSLGANSLSASGPGIRFMWVPSIGAIRAGAANGMEWNLANMGTFSTAFGSGTTASGKYSTASGNGSSATGSSSTALGAGAFAGGEGSTASGYGARAPAWGSTAFGISTWSDGVGSMAYGVGASTTGEGATASGYFTIASGAFSAAFGCYTSASSLGSFVIGTYNVGGGTANAWVDTDPIFEIGNGTSSNPSDAFVINKDGSGTIQGALTGKAGFLTTPDSVATTDIPMYTGH